MRHIGRHLALSSLLLLAGGCSSPHAIHLCRRGDRADVATFVLSFVDGAGRLLATDRVAADGVHDLSFERPGAATSVAVEGVDAQDRRVATGKAALGSDQTCVCVAVLAQHPAVCTGVVCSFSSDQCLFTREDGTPVGSQTLVLGENQDDDVQQVTTDAYLVSDRSDDNYGGREKIDLGPKQTGLLRFDLSALPTTAQIEEAALQLHTLDETGADSSSSVTLWRVLERWDEGDQLGAPGCASWTCRTADGSSWASAGCGPPSSRAAQPLGSFVPDAIGTAFMVGSEPLRSAVGEWVASPGSNFGLAATCEGDAKLVSSEGTDLGRPRLTVRFRL